MIILPIIFVFLPLYFKNYPLCSRNFFVLLAFEKNIFCFYDEKSFCTAQTFCTII